ncbi:MAG: histidinol-phosphate transaminase [Desulfobacterales bacterium]
MSRYWSDIVQRLTPYTPGEQPKIADLIKLNTNENPYGPSPRVLEALAQTVSDDLRRYPDPTGDELKQAIGDYYGISLRQVFVGNGSDEVLAHTFRGLLQHDRPLLFPDITYSFYPVYCRLFEVAHESVPLTDRFDIRLDDYGRPNGGVLLANPNAPTGRLLSLAAIEDYLQQHPQSLMVLDEAYIDFGGESAIALVNRFPNLLVIQTLSKSRGLAGLRVGFAVGQEPLVEALERVKNSFNSYPLDRFALAGAVVAMADAAYFEKTRAAIMATREALTRDLTHLGFEVLPSAANFVFARHPAGDGADLTRRLRQRAILVRHFAQPRIDQFLRITVGTDGECRALVAALGEIVHP